MTNEIEQFIKYAIPGYAIAFPLVIWSIHYYPSLRTSSTVGAIFLSIFLSIGFFLGYLIQQFWMVIFEKTGGYQNEKLARNKKIIEKAKSRNESDFKKAKTELGDDEGSLANLIWEYTLYDDEKIPKEIRNHDGRTWHFYHSLQSTSIRCLFGFFIFLILAFFYDPPYIFLSIFYLISSVLLMSKAKLSKDKLMEYEKNLVITRWKKFESVLKKWSQ